MALLDRYKKAGANFTDQRGTLDVTEFVNIANPGGAEPIPGASPALPPRRADRPPDSALIYFSQSGAYLPPAAGSTPSTVPSGTPGSVNTPNKALIRDGSRTTPFTANHFLTAPKNVPPSPTQADRRPLSTKRQRAEEDDEPVKKQRST